MCLLLETIKIKDGEPKNLKFHQKRMDDSFFDVFEKKNDFNLYEIFDNIKLPKTGTFKFRLIYNVINYQYELIPYQIRKIKSLKKVYANIDYKYKFADRTQINDLSSNKEQFDDILIIKNGYVTDTSYANIIFYDGDKWFTPDTPLLNGTKRQELLANRKVFECQIKEQDLKKYEYAKIINAMIDIEESENIPIDNIR